MCELLAPSPPCAGLDNLYQATNSWREKEALTSQAKSFLSGPSPNFSCCIQHAGSISLAGSSASPPMLTKNATPLELCPPSMETVQLDFLDHCKLAKILSAQSHLLFLQACAEGLQSSPDFQSSNPQDYVAPFGD